MSLSFSNSTTSYTATSSLVYSIGFTYQDQSEVKVRTKLSSGLYQEVTNWQFLGTTSIQFTSTPPSTFEIYRATDLSKSYGTPGYAVFRSGSQLNAGDLNKNFELLRRGIEENTSALNALLFGDTGSFDEAYVNVTGDKMVGNLTLGTTSAINTTLNIDGSATFGGKIQSASTASSDGSTVVTTKDYVDNSIAAIPGTDLAYDSATRVISSSTGTDATLPEVVAAGDSGLLTGADKTKLDGIAAGAQVNVATDLTYTSSTRLLESSTGTDVTLPEVTAAGDSGFMTGADKTKLDGIAAGAQVNVATDLTYTSSSRLLESSTGTDVTLPEVVAAGDSGFMTGADKTKLDGIASGAQANVATDLSYNNTTRLLESSTGTDVTLPEVLPGGYSGLITGSDKSKLDGIQAGAQVNAVTSVNGQTGAVVVSGSTDLTYTASTRLLESSTGTDVTLPEVVAAGDSGLMTGADKTKLDGIASGAQVNNVSTVDSGFTDTVQTSTTQFINNATTYDTSPSLSGSITPYPTYVLFNTSNYTGTWQAGLTALQGLTAGDTFTVNYSLDPGAPAGTTDTVYVFSSAASYPWGLEVNFTSYTGTHTNYSPWNTSFTIGVAYTARVITGSNNPIWDTSLNSVQIGSTKYLTEDWTVSGTQATHNSANPSISAGDALKQVDAVHSLGTSLDTRNSLTLHGNDSSFVITDGTSSLSLGIGPAVFPSTVTAAEKVGITSSNSGYTWNLDATTRHTIVLADSTIALPDAAYNTVIIGHEAGKQSNQRSNVQNSVIIGARAAYNGAPSTSSFNGNVAIGYTANEYIQFSTDNVSIGYGALRGYPNSPANSVSQNVAIGRDSMRNCQGNGVQYNTCVGRNSGLNMNAGDFNTCIGNQSGAYISSGRYNSLLGNNTGTSWSPSGQITTQNGIVCLGDNNVTDLYCADTTIASSDSRDKTDVEDLTLGLDFIQQLRPVTYRWDKRSSYLPDPFSEEAERGDIPSILDIVPDGTHKQDRLSVGFLAQEVEAIEQSYGYSSSKANRLFVNLNEDETAYGLKYERLVPVLVNAIKELKARIEVLEGN